MEHKEHKHEEAQHSERWNEMTIYIDILDISELKWMELDTFSQKILLFIFQDIKTKEGTALLL